MSRNIVMFALLGLLATICFEAQAQAEPPKAPEIVGKKVEAGENSPEAAVGSLVEQLLANPARPSKLAGGLAMFLLDTESGKVTRIADEAEPGLNYCGAVEWARDGKRIIFDITVPGGKDWTKTRLVSIERGERTPLVRHLGLGTFPTATVDGERILFQMNQGMAADREIGLWLMKVDGSERMRLLSEFGRTKLSPDGRLCLIAGISKPARLKLVDLTAGLLYKVEIPDRNVFSVPYWADGETIVAMTGDTESDSISLLDASDPTRVYVKEVLWKRKDETDLRPRSPVYSKVTKRCIFIAKEGDRGSALFSFRPGQANPPKRFDAANGSEIQGLGMSPDGRYVLFSSDRPDVSSK